VSFAIGHDQQLSRKICASVRGEWDTRALIHVNEQIRRAAIIWDCCVNGPRLTGLEKTVVSIQEQCMSKLAIPHNAWVFVSDGHKALFLRNAGDEEFPNLTTQRVFADENPRTHEPGHWPPRARFQACNDELSQ
jgi:hypothetical protein